MAKRTKISSQDFLDLLEDETDESTAFYPLISPNVKHSASKLESKLSQSEAKLEPTKEVNSSQSRAKVESNLSQQNKRAGKLEPQLRPIHESKLSQSEAKLEPKISFDELIGLQRSVLIYIFNSCIISGSRITPPIAISNLSNAVETTISAGRKAVQRLEEKGFIIRSTFKDGRGGWTKYELKDDVYKRLLLDERSDKLEPKLSQSRAKVRTELEPQPEPTAPSSSRDLYLNKTTTTTEPPSSFNVTTVSEFGITESAVARCLELYPNIEPEKMQDLITRFGEFMRGGEGNRVQNARGFFISLAEQLSKGITPLDHIETPENRLMRELVAKKKAEIEEAERLENELREFDFDEWWSHLTKEKRDALVQPNSVVPSGSESQKRLARQMHAEEFWPERKKMILRNAVGGLEAAPTDQL